MYVRHVRHVHVCSCLLRHVCLKCAVFVREKRALKIQARVRLAPSCRFYAIHKSSGSDRGLVQFRIFFGGICCDWGRRRAAAAASPSSEAGRCLQLHPRLLRRPGSSRCVALGGCLPCEWSSAQCFRGVKAAPNRGKRPLLNRLQPRQLALYPRLISLREPTPTLAQPPTLTLALCPREPTPRVRTCEGVSARGACIRCYRVKTALSPPSLIRHNQYRCVQCVVEAQGARPRSGWVEKLTRS